MAPKESEQDERERLNNELIDLAYSEAIRVCSVAEFGGATSHDWDLPTKKDFRSRVRVRREELYRRNAQQAATPAGES